MLDGSFTPFNFLFAPLTLAYSSGYQMIRTVNAVVCGGMLLVMKLAWRTRTRSPGASSPKFICLPKKSNIPAFRGTLNLMAELRLRSVTTVKFRFCLSILTILPVVTLPESFRSGLKKEELSIKYLCLFFIIIFKSVIRCSLYVEKSDKI